MVMTPRKPAPARQTRRPAATVEVEKEHPAAPAASVQAADEEVRDEAAAG